MYGGPKRPDDQIVVLSNRAGTSLISIDGTPVDGSSSTSYEVLPGEHLVRLQGQDSEYRLVFTRYYRSPVISLCFSTQPGHRYEVICRREDDWAAKVVDYNTSLPVPMGCPKMLAKLQQRRSVHRANQSGAAETRVADPSPPIEGTAAVSSEAAAALPVPESQAPAPLASSPAPFQVNQVAEGQQAILPQSKRPGSGFHLALGLAGGGDNLASRQFAAGDSSSLKAGDGVYLTLGGTVTPLWLGDTVGLGFGGGIGWKYYTFEAGNGSLNLSRFPIDLWVQTLLPVSGRWYLLLQTGPHKDAGVKLSGSGVASGEATFYGRWGWMAQAGFYLATSWHSAFAFGLRYTDVHYTLAGETIDASNLALDLTFHLNP
jgi:hypothetical protein